MVSNQLHSVFNSDPLPVFLFVSLSIVFTRWATAPLYLFNPVAMATTGLPVFLFVTFALVFLTALLGVQRKNVKASAVCRFSLPEVQMAFQGPYMENQDSNWKEYVGKIPNPRPGTVSTLSHSRAAVPPESSKHTATLFCVQTVVKEHMKLFQSKGKWKRMDEKKRKVEWQLQG